MNKIKNDLYNDFWDWLDSVSIKYKNYEIKNAIIHSKEIQYTRFMHNVNHFNLRNILSSIKWKLKLNLLMAAIPKHNMFLKIKFNSTYYLCNKNLYAVNISPNDRGFLHIAPLVKRDKNSLVITVRDDVYNYFNEIKLPVILLDIYTPWRKKEDLKINIPLISPEKKFLLSLDIFSFISLLRSASLIDLLDILINKQNLPQVLITQQDFSFYDSTFATYFKGKMPTITLQHGKATISNDDQHNLWKYLISDWMIVFGTRQAEIFKHAGVDFKKIKILGTAKYDLYMDRIKNKLKVDNSKNKRVLLGIQQAIFYKKYSEVTFNFIKYLLNSREHFILSIRFHPAITKSNRKKFINKLRSIYISSKVILEISEINDSLEDISKSTIILVSNSTLAMEAMLLDKPVIECLSKKDESVKFGDYRDFSLHSFEGEEAEKLIKKLFKDNDFYKEIIKKQNKFISKEIMPPPAIPRILNFVNSLNNNRRSVNNK